MVADDGLLGAARVRELAAELPTGLPGDHFRVEPVERLSFPDASFDVVISSAVLPSNGGRPVMST